MKLKYFKLAKKISKNSNHHSHKLGAIVVKKSKIIGQGYNQPKKTHPLSSTFGKTIHAELHAILDCSSKDLTGCDIYVYRGGVEGDPLLAKPCEHCQKLLIDFGIKKVYFSVDGSYDEYRIY